MKFYTTEFPLVCSSVVLGKIKRIIRDCKDSSSAFKFPLGLKVRVSILGGLTRPTTCHSGEDLRRRGSTVLFSTKTPNATVGRGTTSTVTSTGPEVLTQRFVGD